MTTENQPDNNDQAKKDAERESQAAAEDKTLNDSGDPGRTPGSAEGDEETIDADIREKEAEGKL